MRALKAEKFVGSKETDGNGNGSKETHFSHRPYPDLALTVAQAPSGRALSCGCSPHTHLTQSSRVYGKKVALESAREAHTPT